jgi:hypothetical protein
MNSLRAIYPLGDSGHSIRFQIYRLEDENGETTREPILNRRFSDFVCMRTTLYTQNPRDSQSSGQNDDHQREVAFV